MSRLRGYKLSVPADKDIDSIFDYTMLKFGEEQAIKYLEGLDDLFSELLTNPEMGRVRNEVKPGLRSIVYVSHTVFYRILKHQLIVVRVLHGSQDVAQQIDVSYG